MAARKAPAKTKADEHKWEFKARFRREAFGWKSQPAVTRVKQAAAEIRKVARKEPVAAAEGAVAFIERVVPAIEHVDGSSGSIGTAVNNAVADCVRVIADAPAPLTLREGWLERLWTAYQDDGYGYLDSLGDVWGDLCADTGIASAWADQLGDTMQMAWSDDKELRGYFKGDSNCLSALLRAERFDDVYTWVERAPYKTWRYRQFAAKALVAQGKLDEAVAYAEASQGLNDNWGSIARMCEEILLRQGRVDEAFERFAFQATPGGGTYVGLFRALSKKYPHKDPAKLLDELVRRTPGEEGKWFAAAKEIGLFDEAIALAARAPCNPKTLTTAAREFSAERPAFAVEAGLLALHWLAQGYGYEVIGADVWSAYDAAVKAAERLGSPNAVTDVKTRALKLIDVDAPGAAFAKRILTGLRAL